jgi:hypothetical protein
VLVLAIGLLAGCTIEAGGGEASEEEKAAFDERIREELAARRSRKARIIAENRRVLDALPRIAGAKLLDEFQNPESSATFDAPASERPEDAKYERYVRERLADQDYADLTATGWGTFREYAIPAGMSAADVNDFFIRRLADEWCLGVEPAAKGVYLISFAKGKRCVWFHIGVPTGAERRGEIPPGRSYEVATDLRADDSCPGGA